MSLALHPMLRKFVSFVTGKDIPLVDARHITCFQRGIAKWGASFGNALN